MTMTPDQPPQESGDVPMFSDDHPAVIATFVPTDYDDEVCVLTLPMRAAPYTLGEALLDCSFGPALFADISAGLVTYRSIKDGLDVMHLDDVIYTEIGIAISRRILEPDLNDIYGASTTRSGNPNSKRRIFRRK